MGVMQDFCHQPYISGLLEEVRELCFCKWFHTSKDTLFSSLAVLNLDGDFLCLNQNMHSELGSRL